MSALSHFIEAAGVATSGISLVRENTVAMRPPRALWVPFPLGRPLGAPNQPEFQRRVLRATLDLLVRDDGPVILEDFSEDAPGQSRTIVADMEGMVCPVVLKRPAGPEPQGRVERVLHEIALLAPWHEVFVHEHRRSTAAVSGLSLEDAVRHLGVFAATGQAASGAETDQASLLRFAMEDVRCWYIEAASARPGGAAAPDALADWFWGETEAAELFLDAYTVCRNSADASLKLVADRMLLPRSQRHRLR